MRTEHNAALAQQADPGHARRAGCEARLVCVLLLAAVLPYANTLLNGFVYDDIPQILQNPYLQSPRHLREILTTTVWSFQGEQGVSNYYRPLMMLSYLACYQLFGPLAFGFHLINVLLHAVVVWLVFSVARRVFGDQRVAFVSALLFAVHPIHSEVVAWVAAVSDLQLAVLFLGSYLLFLRLPGESDAPEARNGVWRQAAMLLVFALALLAKEPAMMLPALAVVYEHFLRAGRASMPAGAKMRRYAGLWILLAGYLMMRVALFKSFAPVLQRAKLSWPEALLSAVALVGQYAGTLFWPSKLSAFYPFQKSTSLVEAGVLAGLGVLLISLLLFLWLWKRARAAAFAMLWMFATLAPVLNARWMAANVFTERYLYLPSVGFCWLAGWAGVALWDRGGATRRWLRPALAAALAVAAALGAARIVLRNPDWRNDYTLYTQTLATHPDAYLIRANLGTVYWQQGNLAAAEREWKLVVQRIPENLVTLNNLGLVYVRQKRYAEAIELFERAIRLRPAYAMAHINLGETCEATGENEKAQAAYERAVAVSPLNPLARNHLGEFFLRAGKLEEAKEQFLRSREGRPTAEAARSLGQIYLEQGNREQAEQALRRAVELDPYDNRAQLALARIYAESGRKPEAVRAYQAVLETDPRNQEARAALQKFGIRTPAK